MSKRPTFFLSSTIYDFRDLRGAIKFSLEARGCKVLASREATRNVSGSRISCTRSETKLNWPPPTGGVRRRRLLLRTPPSAFRVELMTMGKVRSAHKLGFTMGE